MRRVALALLFAAVGAPGFGQETVRVEALLHEDGRSSRLRNPAGLQLLVGEAPHAFEVAPGDEPLAVAVVVDLSASVQGPLLAAVTSGVGSFLSGLAETDRCALLTFRRSVELLAGWEDSCADAAAAALELRGGGPSALNNALMLALGLLADAPGRPVLAVFTDGVDGASWTRDLWPMVGIAGAAPLTLSVTAPATLSRGGRVAGVYGTVSAEDFAQRIEFQGRHVHSGDVDLRGLRNVDPFWALEELARRSGGGLIRTSGEPGDVEAALAGLADEIALRTSLLFQPPPGLPPGIHPIQVQSPEGDVRHRTAFVRPPPG